MLYKLLTVAGLATFEIYAAIPAGFALGLKAWMIALASIVGGIIGAMASVYLGEKVKNWLSRYRKPKPATKEPKTGLGYRIWKKYGLVGLGVIGTIVIGAPLSIAAGVGLNVPLQRLLGWCCLGIIIRSFLFTYIGHFTLHLL